MENQQKTKKQLINELKKLRQRIIEQDRLEDKRKQAEEALWESENYYRTLVQNLPQKIFLKDKNSVYLSCNENYSQDLKTRPGEITGKTDYDFYPKELAEKYRADDKRIMESGKTEDIEERYIQDGKEVIVHTVKTPIKDEKGKILGILGIFWDITKRKRAEDDLRKYREQLEELVEKRTAELRMANEQLRQEITERKRTEEALREYQKAIEGSKDIIAVVDQNYNYLLANNAFLKYRDMDREQVVGRSIPEVLGKDFFERVVKKNLDTCFQGEVVQYEMKYTYPEFGKRDLLVSYFPIEGPNSVNRVVSVIQDITERKWTENALRESEERYRNLFEGSRDAIYITTREGEILDANQSMLDLFDYSKEEMIGLNARKSYVYPEDRTKFQKEIERKGFVRDYEIKLCKKDGTEMECLLTSTVRRTVDGKIAGYQGIIRDITEYKQIVNELHTEKQRFQTLSENAPFGMVMIDKNSAFRYINSKFKELFGYDLNDVPDGKTWFRKAYPDPTYRYNVISTWINDLKSSAPGEKRPRTFTVTCKDGTVKIINFIPVQLETSENLIALEDITDLKRAEKEKEALQGQLLQSQKMEAVGRLAGGIAHDFNNILTIIKGYSQLSLDEFKGDDSVRRNIEEIQKASQRAADLTRQLLAFSRRQVMEMKVIDLNTLLKDLNQMLCRVIGEDIELITLLADDLGRVKTDPGQIEQVIMNLAVNSRDAMPSGGKFTIETANVELDESYARVHIALTPGHYVMLSVSDTGVGMAPEVRDRVFEPFFTTREKGTGLGLSTVYGIVKQSGGNIYVYSEPGHGTTFKIYLPQVDEPLLGELKEKVMREELPRGSETVLVVEDDEEVRKLAVLILQRQGYKVLQAAHGGDAFLVCQQHKGPFHLMVTDVVMPGMSGPELFDQLILLHPEMKVLYTSGYTDNTIVHNNILGEGMDYIQKPFTVDGLARKVRDILDKDSNLAV
jgi:two-component system cell cycle sensor histidine kinase/response regulator CckA